MRQHIHNLTIYMLEYIMRFNFRYLIVMIYWNIIFIYLKSLMNKSSLYLVVCRSYWLGPWAQNSSKVPSYSTRVAWIHSQTNEMRLNDNNCTQIHNKGHIPSLKDNWQSNLSHHGGTHTKKWRHENVYIGTSIKGKFKLGKNDFWL